MEVAAQSAPNRVRSTTWDNRCYVNPLWYSLYTKNYIFDRTCDYGAAHYYLWENCFIVVLSVKFFIWTEIFACLFNLNNIKGIALIFFIIVYE